MLAKRIIPCLDVKEGRVVKGVNFEGLRDAGDPVECAAHYDEMGADEICFLDITASKEKRGTLLDMVRRTAERMFVPLTVGGGVREEEDVRDLLRAGADKVSINSTALRDPGVLKRSAERYGSSTIVCAIDAKRVSDDAPRWEAFTHGGSRPTGRDAVAWAEEACALGAGEILLTSMDRDGTKDGYDLAPRGTIAERVSVPVIASGGVGNLEHLYEGLEEGCADAVLAASIFHFGDYSVEEVKIYLRERGMEVRTVSDPGIPEVKWNEQGLAPAICQDAGTGQILTLAWVNEESLRLTLEKGTVHFWSRSRGELWHKGETSGNYLRLVSARLDCDADALVFIVRPDGPACHTNRMSCFFNEVPAPLREGGEAALDFDQNLLESIYRLILERKKAGDTDSSYVARLFSKGEDRVLKKIGEEATEVVMAMKDGDANDITNEVADLWFHTLVGLAAHDVPPGRVFAELARRFGRGGRPESER